MKNATIRAAVVAATVFAGTVSAADASRVAAVGLLERSPVTGSWTVGGQLVSLPGQVSAGAFVRVSGYLSADGALLADDVLVLAEGSDQVPTGTLDFASALVAAPASSYVAQVAVHTAGVTGSNVAGVTGSNTAGVTGSNFL